MRKVLVTFALVLLWIAVVASIVLAESWWFAAPSVELGNFTSIENHLVGQLSDSATRRKLGSAALILLDRGSVATQRGFGFADAAMGTPVNTAETLFLVASVSKAVTAWGVMKLVEEGKIGLDDPVLRHLKRWRFPGSEAWGGNVTARHLLSHTAGLDDGLGYGGFPPGEAVQTLEESLTLPRDSTVGPPRPVRVVREPGRVMEYSGGGYAILQLLIEEVTGRPFAEYMREAILQPLGMMNSSFDLEAIVASGRQGDVAPSFDGKLKPQPRRRYAATAAVGLYATPRDLARFAQAFTRPNPVLKPETLKQMLTPQRGTRGAWGLGHALYGNGDARVVGHSGGTGPGWGAMLRVNPGSGNAMVLVVSGGQGTLNLLPHDWVYWETGTVTSEARRQIVYNRALPALLAIAGGVVAIALWKLAR